MGESWRTRDVWGISFSAFFADLGYQAVLAVFPLFLVLTLGAPLWLFGLSQALAYGPGALFGYWGGVLGDRYGRWGVAIAGNALIPLMALSGLTTIPSIAIALLVTGWWARNFRSPPRRAMMVDAVEPSHRGEAFGLLHALDVGGGMLAAAYAFVLVLAGVPYRWVLLIPILSLAVSTIVLGSVRVGRTPPKAPAETHGTAPDPEADSMARGRSWAFWGVMAATTLFGFASFSVGFPILTTAQTTQDAAYGILVFVVVLGLSSAVGLLLGGLRRNRILALALFGYLAAAMGSGLFAVVEGIGGGLALSLIAGAVLGASLGAVETFEPTIIAAISPSHRTSRSLGALTAFRSIGLFVSNLALGLLFLVNGWLPYLYAAVAGLGAMAVMIAVAKQAGAVADAP
ncbi:MAG: MFS transporter [Thermoplasmata archaeon]